MGRSRKPTHLKLLDYVRDVTPSLTYPIYRGMVRVPTLDPELEIRLASTRDELEQAFQLLHEVYVEMGWMDPHSSGLRLLPFNLLPHCSVIIAVKSNKVVGTVSLLRDSDMGLPLDSCFDTSFYRKPGNQIAEVTGLAVAKPYRREGQILFPLLKYLYHYAVDFQKIDILQIGTSPKREDFYRAILFFEPVDEHVVHDPLVNGAPMTALYLDIHHARAQFMRAYGDKPSRMNLHDYFISPPPPQFKFPLRPMARGWDPVWTEELVRYFFDQKTKMLNHLSDHEIHVLKDIYAQSPIAGLLREAHSAPVFPPRRRAQRFLSSCPAILETDDGEEPVTLLDVSETGFRMVTRYPLRLKYDYAFRVQVGPQQSVPLVARPIWNRRRREWGFAMVETPRAWSEYLQYLNHLLSQRGSRAA